MPAHRNDVTHKPIYETTTTRDRWVAVDEMGKFRVIWADSEAEAEAHATEQGWTLHKETNDEST